MYKHEPIYGEKPVPNHPFFDRILRTNEAGGNLILRSITGRDALAQERFLRLLVDGYYPISATSPQAFKRILDLSGSQQTKDIAKGLYETEQGCHPLVGEPRKPHAEEFVEFINSLIRGGRIPVPDAASYGVIGKLNIPAGGIMQALATSYINEFFAPGYATAWLDFRSQWSTLAGIPSEEIKDWFVLEHRLTEGGEPGQHISDVARMLEHYPDITKHEEFQTFVIAYSNTIWEHLDAVVSRMN